MVGRLALPPSPYVISWSLACSFPLLQVTQSTKVLKWFSVFLLEILALFFVFVLFNYLGLHFF
jgi:hypothetical protein